MYRVRFILLWLSLLLCGMQAAIAQAGMHPYIADHIRDLHPDRFHRQVSHPDPVRSRYLGLRTHGGLQTLPYVNDVSCFGLNDGEVGYAFVGGGIPPYTYSIDGLTWGSTPYFPSLGPGTYVIMVMDSAGTTASDTLTVAEPALLDVQAQISPSLCSTFDGSIQLVVTGGISPYVYQWGNGSVDSSLYGLNPGTYYVTVIDNNYCEDSLVITLQQNSVAPVVTVLDSGNVSCNGAVDGYVYVQASGGAGTLSYQWTPAQPGSQDSLQGLGAGAYNLLVTDSVGCVARIRVTLTEPPPLIVTGQQRNPVCAGDSSGMASMTVTGGTPGYRVYWQPPGVFADSITGLPAGTYAAIVEDSNGCTAQYTVVLSDPPQVVADFLANPALPVTLNLAAASLSVQNLSQNATSFLWQWGDGTTDTLPNPGHSYTSQGDFCIDLTAADSSGCTDTARRCGLRVVETELVIPNTFTPNGDGRNDYFAIIGVDQFPSNKIEVFNRWGNRVFEMDNYDNTWDGSNGKSKAALPDGAYFFIFHPNASGFGDIMGEVVIVR